MVHSNKKRSSVKKRTKTDIIITFGRALTYENLVEAFRNGATIVRRSLAFGTLENQKEQVRLIKKAAREAGVRARILDDSPGFKIRLGLNVIEYKPQVGEVVELLLKDDQVSEKKIPTVGLNEFVKDIKVGESIFTVDGQIKLRVIKKLKDRILCRVEASGCPFEPYRGINLPESNIKHISLTNQDIENVKRSVLQPEVEFFALSFLENPQDIVRVRQIIAGIEPTRNLKIIAKIETRRGVQNLPRIAKIADALMVARGDLKLEMPYSQLFRSQLQIINAARQSGKYCIVATEVLMSMLKSLVPNAAEITALGYTILCGIDAIMVSNETTAGQHPTETVRAIHEIIQDAEDMMKKDPQLCDLLRNKQVIA